MYVDCKHPIDAKPDQLSKPGIAVGIAGHEPDPRHTFCPIAPPPRTGALSITRSRSGSTAPTRCAALATALTLVLSACTTPDSDRGYGPESAPAEGSTSAEPTASAGAPDIAEPETVVEGLAAPWSIAFAGDVALVSERDSGRILELTETAPAQAREVGTVPGVAASGEGGLLGLATAEDFLYAYFTAAEDNRIVRFPLDGEPGSFALGSPEVLLDGIPKAGNHNGGRIAFGPDGKLYATAGDAGDRESAQNREALSGKILRLDPDGSVPEDNPFPGSPVYSFGHRNPQGIAWDETGRMFSSEFGQNTWDELNIIEAGGNYGWPDVEGMADPGEGSDFIDPVQQWSTGEASPSGMTITPETRSLSPTSAGSPCARSPSPTSPSPAPATRESTDASAMSSRLPTVSCGCSRTTRTVAAVPPPATIGSSGSRRRTDGAVPMISSGSPRDVDDLPPHAVTSMTGRLTG